jgi:hypothetical protein
MTQGDEKMCEAKIAPLSQEEALHVAARVWADQAMRSRVMDVAAAAKIAAILLETYGTDAK